MLRMSFLDFLEACPTQWHLTHELAKDYRAKRFSELDETKRWKLAKGKRYFTSRGGTTIGFITPKKTLKRIVIFGSHSDSPSFKIKPNSQSKDVLAVEIYGGPILSSWFDRDCYIAGVHKGKPVSHKSTLVTIPSLAIHLERTQTREINKELHIRPLMPIKKKLEGDLFLIPAEPPRKLSGDLVAGYRIDNLASVYGSFLPFLKATPSDHTLYVNAVFSHEEVGSGTDEGAASSLLNDYLTRISYSLYDSVLEYLEAKGNSIAISIDCAHALHPNYLDKYDAANTPVMGKGVAIKHNANMKYATSSHTLDIVKGFAAAVPLQHFAMHGQGSTGSTIGHILSHTLGIPTIDIGIPQLAMHSARELMSMKDLKHLETLVTNGLKKL